MSGTESATWNIAAPTVGYHDHNWGDVPMQTLPGRNSLGVHVFRYRLISLFYQLKLLHPSAPVGLSHINVALGIDRQCVGVGEFADLMARSTET